MPRFKDMPQVPGQMWLMPPCLDEMVPRDSEVRLLSEVMEQLNWNILESSYHDRGTPPDEDQGRLQVCYQCPGCR